MPEANEFERRLAQLSLFAGCAGLATAALLTYLTSGSAALGSPMVPGGSRFLAFVPSVLVYEFATPFLCAAALVFGVRTRDRWPGRVGIALALLAILPYLAFLHGYYEIVSA